MAAIDYEQALLDPTHMFDDPAAVLSAPGLTPEQKQEILKIWELKAPRTAGRGGREHGRQWTQAVGQSRGGNGKSPARGTGADLNHAAALSAVDQAKP